MLEEGELYMIKTDTSKSKSMVIHYHHKDRGYLGSEEIDRSKIRDIGFFPEDYPLYDIEQDS